MNDLKALLCMICSLLAYGQELFAVSLCFVVGSAVFFALSFYTEWRLRQTEKRFLCLLAEEVADREAENDD